MDRFTIIEMDVLNDEEEFGLLKYMFPLLTKEHKKMSPILHI